MWLIWLKCVESDQMREQNATLKINMTNNKALNLNV